MMPQQQQRMTPEQALQILNQATQPGVRLTRQDYVLIETALSVIGSVIQELNAKPAIPAIPQTEEKLPTPG